MLRVWVGLGKGWDGLRFGSGWAYEGIMVREIRDGLCLGLR